MTRITSIETYNKIKESGLLSNRRWQVYDALYELGEATGGEVFKLMKDKYSTTMATNSNTTTRLGELRAAGVAIEIGTRVCSVTTQKVILWTTTNNLPIKFEKPNRHKCKSCNGKGFIEEAQGVFNV